MPEEPCTACDDSPLPGILIRIEDTSVTDSPIYVQRCDQCGIYSGDLEAAYALAQLNGGRVCFLRDGQELEAGAPPYPDDWLIDSGTDPWTTSWGKLYAR